MIVGINLTCSDLMPLLEIDDQILQNVVCATYLGDQFGFLHHILSTSEDDPVKAVYSQQLQYEYERNWANEIKELRTKYGIKETDEEILALTKAKWKFMVKRKIHEYVLQTLNNNLSNLKHCNVRTYEQMKQQEYLTLLSPAQARAIFQIRTGVYDIKACRKYKYEDMNCRLCGASTEDVFHVVNVCTMIPRDSCYRNCYENNITGMKIIADRCIKFAKLVKQQEK